MLSIDRLGPPTALFTDPRATEGYTPRYFEHVLSGLVDVAMVGTESDSVWTYGGSEQVVIDVGGEPKGFDPDAERRLVASNRLVHQTAPHSRTNLGTTGHTG